MKLHFLLPIIANLFVVEGANSDAVVKGNSDANSFLSVSETCSYMSCQDCYTKGGYTCYKKDGYGKGTCCIKSSEAVALRGYKK